MTSSLSNAQFMSASEVKKRFSNPDRSPGQWSAKASYAGKLEEAKNSGLYDQIKTEGIQNPIVLQKPGTQRFSSLGVKPQIFDGTHRLAIMHDIDPNAQVPVRFKD